MPCIKRTVWVMPPDLAASLARSRERWAELEAAGTPYWCVHEDRAVSHERAYVWPDNPGDPIYSKHGVRCAECGGYIQVG